MKVLMEQFIDEKGNITKTLFNGKELPVYPIENVCEVVTHRLVTLAVARKKYNYPK